MSSSDEGNLRYTTKRSVIIITMSATATSAKYYITEAWRMPWAVVGVYSRSFSEDVEGVWGRGGQSKAKQRKSKQSKAQQTRFRGT